jgi:hypothetical protein
MKKIALLFVAVLFTSSINTYEVKADTEIIMQNKQPSVMELAFIRSLNLTILEIMASKSDEQIFTAGRIEKITRNIDNDTYDVSLRVVSFKGPLNPPYKLIRITLRIPGKNDKEYSVISYKSHYISDKEFVQFNKNTGY